MDGRVDKIAKLEDIYTNLWLNIKWGLNTTFDNTVGFDRGKVDDYEYARLGELLKEGTWLNYDIQSDLQGARLAGTAGRSSGRFFQFNAINSAWKTFGDVFIFYFPYGKKVKYRDTIEDKIFESFNRNDCEELIKTYPAPFSSCEGEALAILVGDPARVLSSEDSGPVGGMTEMDFEYSGGHFDWKAAMSSSITGWLQHGFDSNTSNPVYQSLEGPDSTSEGFTLESLDQLSQLAEVKATDLGQCNPPAIRCEVLYEADSSLFKVSSIYPYARCLTRVL